MKKISLIITILSIAALSIQAMPISDGKSVAPETNYPNAQIIELQEIPYASSSFIPMSLVAEKGSYKVFRASSDYINEIPSCTPAGTNYRYFVFKDNSFLMTVNECNKDVVYKYFVNQI